MKKYVIVFVLLSAVLAFVNCEDEKTIDDLVDYNKGCCTQPEKDESGDYSIAHSWDTSDIKMAESACLLDEGHTWNDGDCAVPSGTMGCKSSSAGHDNITWYYGESWTEAEVRNSCESTESTFVTR